MAWLTETQLKEMGFATLGRNVLISDKASIYNPSRISIGDFSRIDDFSIISAGNGGIEIGRNVHIASFSSLIGAEKITLADFSGLSSRVSIYSSSDDYSGAAMSNPTVPNKYTKVSNRPIYIGRHALVGSGSIILPGANLADGSCLGALSLLTKKTEDNSTYSGCPAKLIKKRKTGFLELEKQLIESESRGS